MSDQQEQEEDIDFSQSGGPVFSKQDVKEFNIEKEKIALARLVLFWLAILFILALCIYAAKSSYVDKDASKAIFEFVKEAFPPIVTLVLGAYFTRRND